MPPLLRACLSFLPFLLHQPRHQLQGREGILVVLQGQQSREPSTGWARKWGSTEEIRAQPGEIRHCALSWEKRWENDGNGRADRTQSSRGVPLGFTAFLISEQPNPFLLSLQSCCSFIQQGQRTPAADWNLLGKSPQRMGDTTRALLGHTGGQGVAPAPHPPAPEELGLLQHAQDLLLVENRATSGAATP